MRSRMLTVVVSITAVAAGASVLQAQTCIGQPVNIFNVALTSPQSGRNAVDGRVSLSVDNEYAAFTIEQRAVAGSPGPRVLYGLESMHEFQSPGSPWATCVRFTFGVSKRRQDTAGDVSYTSTAGRLNIGLVFGRRVQVSSRVALVPNLGIYLTNASTTYKASSDGALRPMNVLHTGGLFTTGVSVVLPGNLAVQPQLQLPTSPALGKRAFTVSMSYGFMQW